VSPRAQCDRQLFSTEWRKVLERTDNLFILQENAVKILLEESKVSGVETVFGTRFRSRLLS
jgi:tRNA uridine 5-carboxymethylaminomethyl modification enzyme